MECNVGASRRLDFDFTAQLELQQVAGDSKPISPSPLMELETVRGDDGRGVTRLHMLPAADRTHTDQEHQRLGLEVLPAGLSLPWLFGLGVYRAEQRDGLMQVELTVAATPTSLEQIVKWTRLC